MLLFLKNGRTTGLPTFALCFYPPAGFLFFFVLEFVDLIYLVPPLLLPASHSPRMVPVAMGAPFSSGSLAEFWGAATSFLTVLDRF